MPRKNRIWYPGLIYHVTARGNRKESIFKDENDYKMYLHCIEEAVKYYSNKYKIISYCLMTNHVHLQVKTEDIHIGRLIGRINFIYAMSFNKKYDYIGHLFQGRYASEVIDDDKYLLQASKYIHRNPVRAKLVAKPEDYRWSSYNMYIGREEENIISSDMLLSYFKNNKDNSRGAYKDFIEAK